MNHKMRERDGIISVIGFSRPKESVSGKQDASDAGDIGSFQPLIVLSDERQDDVEESWRVMRRRWGQVAREVKN